MVNYWKNIHEEQEYKRRSGQWEGRLNNLLQLREFDIQKIRKKLTITIREVDFRSKGAYTKEKVVKIRHQGCWGGSQ